MNFSQKIQSQYEVRANLNVKGKDFTLDASPERFSARQTNQNGDCAIPVHDWGKRIRKAAFDWMTKEHANIQHMTFHDFLSALNSAVGKYPHVYNQMD